MRYISSLCLAMVLIVTLLPGLANAGMKVYVESNTPDSLGKEFVYYLKENIRASKGMELVNRKEDSLFQIRIVTRDTDRRNPECIYSVVFTVATNYQYLYNFLNHTVGLFTNQRAKAAADSITAGADEIFSSVIAQGI